MITKKLLTSIQCMTLILLSVQGYAQTQTVGLFLNDTVNTFKGYTLFAPKHNSMTYLIDNGGHKIHEWKTSIYPPGQTVYLLENGNLLRTCMTSSTLGTGGGEGGRIEEYNWNDSLVWSMDYSTNLHMQHHDIKRLPNGNIIMLVVEKKTIPEMLAAGFDTSNFQPDVATHGFFLPDEIVEIHPTYPSGGNVVWEWHVWDHLIQNFNATKSNYGVPSAHPELIDCAGDHKKLPLFWNHMNSIDYNADFDQIAVSSRGNSEVWIIDHSTTTSQAAGHTGGNRGKGGDLLYRWGNPITYGAGVAANQKYFQQHDVEWIKTGCPGAGNLTCFNNGVSLNYSTIDEIKPPVDALGNYSLTSGSAYGPSTFTWTYQGTPPSSMYSENISGAQRLPNGNTIICVGANGTFLEVTASGNLVWKYVNPTANTVPLYQGNNSPADSTHPDETLNSVFRVYRYPLNYAAFTGKDMTPGNFIEQYYPLTLNSPSESKDVFEAYPNPFTDHINIEYDLGRESNIEIMIYDHVGRLVKNLLSTKQESGRHSFNWNIGLNQELSAGLYFCVLQTPDMKKTLKIVRIE